MSLYVKGDRVWCLDEGKSKKKYTVAQQWGTRVMVYDDKGIHEDMNEKDLGFLPAEHENIMEDKRGMSLSHYVLAERMMHYEAYLILRDIREENNHDNLIHLLSDGCKGYHKMDNTDLVAEWGDSEEGWYGAYEDGNLPWEVYEEDPINTLEQDENGEVAYAGRKAKRSNKAECS